MNINREGRLDFADMKYVVDDSDRRVIEGDVLFNNTNSPALIGKTAYVKSRGPLAYSNHMTRLRYPLSEVDGRFLAHQLHALWRTGYFMSICSNHVNQASVATKRLLQVEVVVPPLDEQRRIVELLESHLSRIDAASTGLGQALARTRRLREAALARAISSTRSHVSTELKTIGDLATVTTGVTPLKSNKAFYDGGTIPWITSGDLSDGVVSSASQFVTQEALDHTSLKVVKAGAILLAMYGEGKTRGTAALLDIDATTNQACAAIQLHDASLRPWVKMVLESNYSAMRRMAAGGVQPNLNLSIVRSIEVPVPAPDVRASALDGVLEVDERSAILHMALDANLRRGSSLCHALLAAAFSGALTAA